jgi:release factor glutamine methyltransferase
MRIADWLTAARQAGVERLDAQLLLAHLLNRPRAWLLAHDEQLLHDKQVARLRAQLQQRAAGVPLAYLVGEREFCGLRLQVTPDVLVPRPETELLVEWALERLTTAPADSVVDLGTGSGAIALAVKQRRPGAAVIASDASAAALRVAQSNGTRHGLAVEWLHGDWWAPLRGRRFGLAVSNPPYVAGDDPHLAALAHEPRGALTPEGDGLAALRRIVQDAPAHLLPGAWLLLEHGHDQAKAVQALLAARGFVDAQTRLDLAGLPRCTGATWRPETPVLHR